MGRYADELEDGFFDEVEEGPRVEYYMAIVFQILKRMDEDWDNVVDEKDSIAFQKKWRSRLRVHFENFPDGYNTPRNGISEIINNRFGIITVGSAKRYG